MSSKHAVFLFQTRILAAKTPDRECGIRESKASGETQVERGSVGRGGEQEANSFLTASLQLKEKINMKSTEVMFAQSAREVQIRSIYQA
jgi:hypothetical protein